MSRFRHQNFFFPALLRERLSVIEVSQPESHYQFTRVGENWIMLLNWFRNPSEKKQFDNITTTRSYLHQRSTSFNILWLFALVPSMRSCFGLVSGNGQWWLGSELVRWSGYENQALFYASAAWNELLFIPRLNCELALAWDRLEKVRCGNYAGVVWIEVRGWWLEARALLERLNVEFAGTANGRRNGKHLERDECSYFYTRRRRCISVSWLGKGIVLLCRELWHNGID